MAEGEGWQNTDFTKLFIEKLKKFAFGPCDLTLQGSVRTFGVGWDEWDI